VAGLVSGKCCGPFLEKGGHTLPVIGGVDRNILQFPLDTHRGLQKEAVCSFRKGNRPISLFSYYRSKGRKRERC
jgi:hypothetical protein